VGVGLRRVGGGEEGSGPPGRLPARDERHRVVETPLRDGGLEPRGADWVAREVRRLVFIAPDGSETVLEPPEPAYVLDRLRFEPVLADAARGAGADLRVGTADNDVNAIRNMGMLPQGYTVNHFLTDPDAWFVKTDAPNGLKHFERAPLRTAMEADFDTGNMRYKGRERYSLGWSDPLGLYGSPGAS